MIRKNTIKIGKQKFVLKAQSYRAMFLFEDITDKPVSELTTFKDKVTYIYCVLKVSNTDFYYTLENFFDLLENDDSVIAEFAKLTEKKKWKLKRATI
jgi:hypothetical protein